jgi:hypothetical protein
MRNKLPSQLILTQRKGVCDYLLWLQLKMVFDFHNKDFYSLIKYPLNLKHSYTKVNV